MQSVERAMILLEILSQHHEGCRLSQLGREAGLSPSTAHRLLTTLEKRRHVQFDPRSRRWNVGLALLTIGAASVRRTTIVSVAQPYLHHLRDQAKETANLGMAGDGQITLISQIPSRQIARTLSPIGGRVPMTSSAMGKAILSTYPLDDIEEVVGLRRMIKRTARSIVHAVQLQRELHKARIDRYAVDDAESDKNVRCVASVIFDEKAEAVCAISISGQVDRMSADRVRQLAPKVIDTALKITQAIGGRPPLRYQASPH
ncbi:IclR family transcriptional regulator [Rhizobium sp. Nf11,1]|uniref:IclR family transcriptional regulator n=1 Tax=Rhizobium sp. Nf11,1 TaxID=3404923 RepID=UPI003D353ED8